MEDTGRVRSPEGTSEDRWAGEFHPCVRGRVGWAGAGGGVGWGGGGEGGFEFAPCGIGSIMARENDGPRSVPIPDRHRRAAARIGGEVRSGDTE